MAGAGVRVFNYTGHPVNAEAEGVGSGAGAYNGGGALNCCVAIPVKWYPGLSANILWHTWDKEKQEWVEHKAQVPIPEYTKPSAFQIHVVSEDEVKVYVSPFMPAHPEHPLYPLSIENRKRYDVYEQQKAVEEKLDEANNWASQVERNEEE